MSKSDLRKKAEIAPDTMKKIRRDEAYEKIARQWCERHKIDIVE